MTKEEIANNEFEKVGDEKLFPNHSDKDIWVNGFIEGLKYAERNNGNQLTSFTEWLKDNHSIVIHDRIIQDYLRYGVAVSCDHNFVQKDMYWKSCEHCGKKEAI